jgi:RNA polymerase sigma-70 factor (ECF subfamily)
MFSEGTSAFGGRVPGDGRADREFRREAIGCLDGLYSFALALSRNPSMAEDLVQETYVRALSARHRAAPEENLRGWLFTILRNVWRNEVRRRRPEALDDGRALAETLPAGGDGPEESLERRETGGRLRQAIEGLPEPFREVVVLRFVQDFSYREVAEVLGCPAGTVMSRLARARALLRKELAPPNGRREP